MNERDEIYLDRAEESLAGAESEYVNGRYNNCANRSYYACFQAAIQALLRLNIVPRGGRDQWSHEFVQSGFATECVSRRKLYPSELRTTLTASMAVRLNADYGRAGVSETQALRTLRRARELVGTVLERGGGSV